MRPHPDSLDGQVSNPEPEGLSRKAPSGVLVCFERSKQGRSALRLAAQMAQERGVPLTVAVVARQEPTDIGCATCRRRSDMWNRELRSVGHQRLSEAAELLSDAGLARYVVACGPSPEVVAQTADTYGADVIVLPVQWAVGIRRWLGRDRGERLRELRRWEVVVAPRSPDRHACDDVVPVVD